METTGYSVVANIDEQEMAERTEAATAYAGESPEHFIAYGEDCLAESDNSTKDIRAEQDACWSAYNRKLDYSNKEDWQSKIVTNDPYQIAQQGKATIRKILIDKADFFDVVPTGNEDKPEAEFWKKALAFWTGEQRGNFATIYADALEMGLITGQSLEIIPIWGEDGLTYVTVEPWKIKRDPDAAPRDPWSGNYWIHTEFIDLWLLKQKEVEGYYINTDRLAADTSNDLEYYKKNNLVWNRGKFRKSVAVREFYGVVLSPRGELLLPNATYTWAGKVIIKAPIETPYMKMRWPGVSFSPLPSITRFGGEGLINGILPLWRTSCNLWNLYLDNMNWVVNGISETDIGMLKDPSDTALYPGKNILTNMTNGQNAFKEYRKDSKTNDVLAAHEHMTRMRQNGSFVNDFIQGLPGSRSDITLGEVELKTQQSLGVFDSIAKDCELGATNVLWASYEVAALNWTMSDKLSPTKLFPDDEYAAMFEDMEIPIRRQVVDMNANIKVSSISSTLRRGEFLQRLFKFMEIAQQPQFAIYTKPYETLKSAVDALSLGGAGVMVSDEEKMIADQIKDLEDEINGLTGGPQDGNPAGTAPGGQANAANGSTAGTAV